MAGYRLLDAGDFEKLEQIGPLRLRRPAAAATWRRSLAASEWEAADATFERREGGEGRWHFRGKRPQECSIELSPGVRVLIRLTDFGHIGIFPEHHEASALVDTMRATEGFRLLNLFAYTGSLTLMAAHAGAEVVHVDASKTSVAWARENAAHAGLEERPVRWIVDDVRKFVARELRRGRRYDGIVLDPPSFGRGVKGEVWKIEEDLTPLLEELSQLRSERFSLVQLSAHSPGYSGQSLANMLAQSFGLPSRELAHGEMSVATEGGLALPSGSFARWSRS